MEIEKNLNAHGSVCFIHSLCIPFSSIVLSAFQEKITTKEVVCMVKKEREADTERTSMCVLDTDYTDQCRLQIVSDRQSCLKAELSTQDTIPRTRI